MDGNNTFTEMSTEELINLATEIRMVQGDPEYGTSHECISAHMEIFKSAKSVSDLAAAMRQLMPQCRSFKKSAITDAVKLADSAIRTRERELRNSGGNIGGVRTTIDRCIEQLIENGIPHAEIPARAYYALMEVEDVTIEKIKTCLTIMLSEHRKAALNELNRAIAWDGTSPEEAICELEKLIGPAMRFPQQSNLAARVLAHFMRNAKLKCLGRIDDVDQHVSPVIHSKQQSTGKSEFAKNFCSPFKLSVGGVLGRSADLEQLTDERHWVSLGNTPLIFLDEMSKAKRSDTDMLKAFITAPVLTPRMLHTHMTAHIPNISSCIGTSNCTSVGELIGDTTGIRRFFGIEVTSFIGVVEKKFEGAKYWKTINPDWPNLLPPEFLDHQEAERPRSVLEEFVAQVCLTYRADAEWHSTMSLQQACCDYGKRTNRNYNPSLKSFSQELALLLGACSEFGGPKKANRGFRVDFNSSEINNLLPFREG